MSIITAVPTQSMLSPFGRLYTGSVGVIVPGNTGKITWTDNTGGDVITNIVCTNTPTGLTFNLSGLGTHTVISTFSGTPIVAGTFNLTFSFATTPGPPPSPIVGYNIQINAPCLASDSEILMANGSKCKIQNIKRGDIVYADNNIKKTFTVSRVLQMNYLPDSEISVCKFQPNSLSKNIPNRELIITNLHPIVHDKARRHAIRFTNLKGVESFEKIKVCDILPTVNNAYYLWDLQFDTVGTFVANGVTVQSRHPQSFISPLPKELYIRLELYSTDIKNDHDEAYELPLVYDIVKPKN